MFVYDAMERTRKELAIDKSVVQLAMRNRLYGNTTTFGILTSLSLAGMEYRGIGLI